MIGNNSCGTHALVAGKTGDNVASLRVVTYGGETLEVGAYPEAPDHPTAGDRRVAGGGMDALGGDWPPCARSSTGTRITSAPASPSCRGASAATTSTSCSPSTASTWPARSSAPSRPAPWSPRRRSSSSISRRIAGSSCWATRMCSRPPTPCRRCSPPAARARGLRWDPRRPDARAPPQRRAPAAAARGTRLAVRGAGRRLTRRGGRGRRAPSPPRWQPARCGAATTTVPNQARLWLVRESALGGDGHPPGRRPQPRGLGGRGGAARAPRRVPARDHRAVGRVRLHRRLYGHFGQGCVHTRNNFDLHTREGLARYRAYVERAADLVVSLGGSLSGEHGDGQSRGELLARMYGPDLVDAFRGYQGGVRSRRDA